MSVALLIARLVLAAVFVVAGVAKLVDLAGSRRAVRDFGFPDRVAGVGGTVLPFAELAIAIALIPTGTARFGALAALVLVVVFVFVIARSMARGEEPDCHCFGQLHSAPAGRSALARNVVIGGLAGFVVIAGWSDAGASATGWVATLDATQTIGLFAGLGLVAAVGCLSWFSWQLLRQNGRLLRRLEAVEQAVGVGSRTAPHGLAVGSDAPAFSLPSLSGAHVALEDLLARGHPVLLVFSDPSCGPCTALLPDIGSWQLEHSEQLTVAVISRGTADANRSGAEEHGVSDLLLQEDREVAAKYDAHATPSAVLIDTAGLIASPLVAGSSSIVALVDRTRDLAALADDTTQTLPADFEVIAHERGAA